MEGTVTISLKEYEEFVKLKLLLESNERVIHYYNKDREVRMILKVDEEEVIKTLTELNSDMENHLKKWRETSLNFKEFILNDFKFMEKYSKHIWFENLMKLTIY